MFNDDFEFYPDHQRNMRFEKPMHGPPGRGGPPGHHMRPPGPPIRRRIMPDGGPPNFRGPREPMFDNDFNPPHGMPPMGIGGNPQNIPHMGRGPHFNQGGREREGNQCGSPRQLPQPVRMQQRPPMIQSFGVPPPGFPGGPGGGGGTPNRPPHAANHVPPNSGNSNLSLDLTGDVFVETQTADGKTYYYNARSRESTWTKPVGNVKIFNQEQIEAIAAAAGSESVNQKNESPKPAPVVAPSAPVNPPVNQFPFVPMGLPGMGPISTPNMGMLPPPPFRMPPPPFAMPPPGMISGPGFLPPFGMPPPVFPGVPVPVAPVANCTTSDNVCVSSTVTTTTISEVKNSTPEPSSSESHNVLEGDEWVEFKTDDKTTPHRVYYYNKKTGETTWEKPESFEKEKIQESETDKNIDDGQCLQIAESGTPDPINEADSTQTDTHAMEVDESLIENKSEQTETEEEKNTTPPAKEVVENGADIDENIENSKEKEQPEEEKSQKPVDKSRPVSSTAIPGTPWCLVLTGDGRYFYFKPSSRTSVWEKPAELMHRADVDKLIEKLVQVPPTTQVKREDKTENDDSSIGPDAKRVKLEDNENDDDKSKNEAESSQISKNISPGKDSAIEAELRAAKERAVIPLETRMKKFKDLLIEKDVSAFSTFSKELHKIVFDSRYLLLTSKERKQVFERYVKERAEEERNEMRKKMRQRKDDFKKLLEQASLTTKSTFSDFAKRYGKDERFKMIEKMRERESMFNDFLQDLRRKERDERSSQREKIKKDFTELLKEQKLDKHGRWSEIKKGLSDDSRYKAVDSSSLREEWFKEFVNKLSHDVEDDVTKEREKQERVEASIREREKEVQRTLSTHLKERDKERELHKHDEAVQHFKALLTDLVRSPDVSWHDMKKTLRKDHRWDASSLQRDERERYFEEHISFLYRKKKEKFRELLDETSEITLTSSWKEVKKLIKDDPRCSKFSSSDRKCEKEFKEYLKDKMVAAKADFRELLKETKIITYKSRKLIEETDHLHDIEKVLQNDKRYLVLKCIEDERRELLMSYIETLDRKGPPPPPTASEPSRRSTK